MKALAIGTAVLAFAIGFLGSSANAAETSTAHKSEATIIGFHSPSGTVRLSNGAVLNQSNLVQSPALEHLYVTQGIGDVQRKLQAEIRYVANGSKA